jgi:DNA-binding transcriptional MerR regulator
MGQESDSRAFFSPAQWITLLQAQIRAGRGEHTCSKLQGFPDNVLSVMDSLLPAIPAKRYFTIGEVGELCGVKPHVLRYWEQEFTQLRPVKRRGNRRYYQRHEVMMIRRIRGLLYDQGFTISGARNKLLELTQSERQLMRSGSFLDEGLEDNSAEIEAAEGIPPDELARDMAPHPSYQPGFESALSVHQELLQIRAMLTV